MLLVVQAFLVGLGRTDLHRRLGIAGAVLAVAMVVTGTEGALMAARRRLHPATLWAGLAVLASQPFRLWVSGTAAWLAFARWATGLGG